MGKFVCAFLCVCVTILLTVSITLANWQAYKQLLNMRLFPTNDTQFINQILISIDDALYKCDTDGIKCTDPSFASYIQRY